MKDLLKTMINHPIATWIVAGTLFGGVAQIVSAARGDYSKNGVNIKIINPEVIVEE